jgi:hypothetical protein
VFAQNVAEFPLDQFVDAKRSIAHRIFDSEIRVTILACDRRNQSRIKNRKPKITMRL